MAFWHKQTRYEPTPKDPPCWEQAMLISPIGSRSKCLPLGWYIYQEGKHWYGMKPDRANNSHYRSTARDNPKELEEWLGTKLPDNLSEPEHKLTLNERLTLANQQLAAQEAGYQVAVSSQAQTSQRNVEISDPIECKFTNLEALPTESSMKIPQRTRDHRLYARMTSGEYRTFMAKVKKSGMTQQSYLLSKIQQEDSDESDFQTVSAACAQLNQVFEGLRLLLHSPCWEDHAQEKSQFLHLIKTLNEIRKQLESFLVD